ncbi:MAG: flagellar biosynthesis anti-sigma factor FlgM [Parasphingorhabdus sp.]|uniref:flagellar biosynthesis anti-sigma factor FlgM n=1 Tax=Parasphingorhabdus sp. TaxID=2709688 RepID=UPI003002FF32
MMIDKINAAHGRSIDSGYIDNIGALRKTSQPDLSRGAPQFKTMDGPVAGAIADMMQQPMPVDRDHVTAIRRAIAEGEYPINSALIAEKMIDFDRSGSQHP